MDIGIGLTGAVAAAGVGRAAYLRRDVSLPCVMIALWGAAFGLWMAGATMATFVFTAVLLNLLVGLVALIVLIHDPRRGDARLIGGLSMAIMPAHFIMSATNGQADWTIYSWSCNTVFVLQCLIAGGWLDRLGRGIGRIVDRLRPVSRFRDGEV